MNVINAVAFFILGLAMMVSPELTLLNSTAALWLEFMGAVIFLIGSGYTAKCLNMALSEPVAVEEAPVVVQAQVAKNRSSSVEAAADGNRAMV